MAKYNLIEVDNGDILRKLYEGSAFTFEGFNTDPENINSFLDAMVKEEVLDETTDVDVFLIKGRMMNNHYKLSDNNMYGEELNIVSINLDMFRNISKLAMIKMQVGARWFDDIVDNNSNREL